MRIIDANCNRLREGLRVIEEYFRFWAGGEFEAVRLKQLRHAVRDIEAAFQPDALLRGRDTTTDPFSGAGRPEEMTRNTIAEVLICNFRRAQEAARVIEEYAKISGCPQGADEAKKIRFALYAEEKDMVLAHIDAGEND